MSVDLAGQSSETQPLILHMIDELKLSGAETHLATMIAEAQRSYPFRHRVVSLFGDGLVGERIRSMGVPVDHFDFAEAIMRQEYFHVAHGLYRYLRGIKPDLVEATSTWSRLLGLPAAWMAGVPRRFAFEQGDIFFSSWKWRAINFLFQFFPERTVVCSHALKEYDCKTYGFFPGRVEVLHNCLDIERFGQKSGEPISRSDFFGDEVQTLFCAVGTLGRGVNKRMDIPIRAIASLKRKGLPVGLVICGDGPQMPELKGLTEDLGVYDRVKLLGTRTDVDRVMSVCDAFCHATPFEPFGIVCIEAMWMGLPPIVPRSGGIAEIVNDSVDGFRYPALDAEALAEKMEILHLQPNLRKTMGQNARQKVARQFTAEAYLKKLYRVYGISESV